MPSPQRKLRTPGSFRRSVAALSVVQGANYLIPLVSVPYLVRILGPDRFGLIAFAQSFIQYFAIATDYGFNFSATRSVAVARNDPDRTARLFLSVTVVKLMLMMTGLVLMLVIIFLVPRFRPDWELFLASYLAVLGSVLFPVWLFQGLEQMGRMAALSLSGRAMSVVGLFVLVHRPSDYLLAAALQASGTPIAGLLAIAPLCKMARPRLSWPSAGELRETLSEGWPLFLSSAAITFYTSSNVFIVGLMESPAVVAYYSAADKIVRAALGVLQPVTQALYPRMSYLFSVNTASALQYLRRLVAPIVALAVLMSLALALAASVLVITLFGPEMRPTVRLLRIMAAVPVFVALSNIVGVQLLFPMGFYSRVSRFQISAAIASLGVLIPMVWSMGANGAALNYTLSEIVITAGFFIIAMKVLKNRATAT